MFGWQRFRRAVTRTAAVFWLAFPALAWGQGADPIGSTPPGPLPIPVPSGTPPTLLEEEVLASPGTSTSPGTAGSPAPSPATSTGECKACESFDWKKVPRTRPFPRPGFFPVPPTGPGYYSLLDQIRGECRKAPPKWPYPRSGLAQPSFFDLDNFSYLDDPKNTELDYTDCLHRIRHNDWLFVTGGDIRGRYESHYNARLTQRDNDFGLGRIRTYGDLWYKDDFRLYVEFITAGTAWQNLAPLPIDQNKADFLNLFIDLKVGEWEKKPIYARIGRQELLFGSQRLISPLEWANTRRTYQGVRGFRQGEKWDFDAFWVQPVIPQANKLDSVDNNINFAGTWATYKPKAGQTVDLYYLLLDDVNRTTVLGIPRNPSTRHTLGSRYSGNQDQFLFDFEGAMQFGSLDGRDIVAGMATAGVGYNFKNAKWNPTIWAYYDYASGGGSTGSGTVHTFNQLFPFGHYYLGWIDQVGRQNIHDVNFHLYTFPTKWMTTWVQFHSFWLANSNDALYNAAGVPIRRSPAGNAGTHVGEEIDLVCNFHLTTHIDLMTGYSYLWGGEFLRNTSSPTLARNAGFYFTQLTYRW